MPTEGNFQDKSIFFRNMGFDIVKFYFYLKTPISSVNFF